jgi:DNA polymerase III alpha subunit
MGPFDDPQVWDLIAGGGARAVHHIESPAMISLCKMCNVRDIDTLIAIVSVIRPGAANESKKMEFARRYQGLSPVHYPHPSLKPCLHSTYGLVVYEEHILQMCESFAGLPPGRADILRRALAKEKTELIDQIQGEFADCARKLGRAETEIAEVWNLVAGFRGYAFCKAHSTAYGVEAYQSAWIKLHYPAEFMAAVLTNGKGFYDPLVYILECHRLGIPLLPPSVNDPDPQFTVCLGAPASRRRVELATTLKQNSPFEHPGAIPHVHSLFEHPRAIPDRNSLLEPPGAIPDNNCPFVHRDAMPDSSRGSQRSVDPRTAQPYGRHPEGVPAPPAPEFINNGKHEPSPSSTPPNFQSSIFHEQFSIEAHGPNEPPGRARSPLRDAWGSSASAGRGLPALPPRAIRVPVLLVKGLTNRTKETILRERAHGEFISLTDFFLRVQPLPEEMEALIRAGAFDSFGQTRTAQYWSWRASKSAECGVRSAECEDKKAEDRGLLITRHLPLATNHQIANRKSQIANQPWLLPPGDLDRLPSVPLVEPGRLQRLQAEEELLGYPVSGHPLELFPDIAWGTYCPINRLGKHIGEQVVTCGLVIEQRLFHQVTGEPMKFLTIADWTGIIETELFARTYQSYGLNTIRYRVLEITAAVEPYENNRGHNLRVLRAGKPRVKSATTFAHKTPGLCASAPNSPHPNPLPKE